MQDKTHILLVDDDPLMRRLFGGKLTTAGYEVIYSTNGPDGREEARRLQPDLILMDINMPGFEDGLATTKRLKTEKETNQIPVILLTNYDMSLDAEQKIKEIGADSFIHKSIELDEFIEKIKKFMAEQKKNKSKKAQEKVKKSKKK